MTVATYEVRGSSRQDPLGEVEAWVQALGLRFGMHDHKRSSGSEVVFFEVGAADPALFDSFEAELRARGLEVERL